MKKITRIFQPLLCLVLLCFLFLGSVVTVHADTTYPTEDIALNTGFYCLFHLKKTPMPNDPVEMTAVPSTEYTGYSQDVMDQVAAAVILRGNYYLENDITIDESTLQAAIWAIVCEEPGCFYNGRSIHLNRTEQTADYVAYVKENYKSVVGDYTMTIWVSSDREYQDVLEAKMVEKHAVPSVEKKVKDRNDSASPDFDQRGWQDSADYDIGDSIPFQITAQMNDISSFKAFYLEFVDHMTHLTLDRDSLRVTIDGVDQTHNFKVDWNPTTKDLNIKCEDITKLKSKEDGPINQVVVNYNATLDEDALIATPDEKTGYGHGNPNEVYMIYSRTTGSADKGISPTDKVTIFTYAFSADKVDENGDPLYGAAFELFKQIAGNTGEAPHFESLGVIGAVKNNDGSYTLSEEPTNNFTWSRIDDGVYQLVEVVTPVGYNTMKPLTFTINALHDHLSEDPVLHHVITSEPFRDSFPFDIYDPNLLPDFGDDGTIVEDDSSESEEPEVTEYPTNGEQKNYIYSGLIEADIVNKPGTVLPETGGMGTYPIYLASAVMMITAAVLLLKKMRA